MMPKADCRRSLLESMDREGTWYYLRVTSETILLLYTGPFVQRKFIAAADLCRQT
jgi:hypothetical protein